MKPKKLYPVDAGLITAYAVHPDTKRVATLETAIFCALRASSDRIFYYNTKQGWEVDFFVHTVQGAMRLVQVCVSLKEETTRKREIRALLQAMQELSLKEAEIVTLEEEETLSFAEGSIAVIPAWKFLLASQTL